MSVHDRGRAQRWHDTDHGAERGEPLHSNQFRVAVDEPEPQWVSSCWCCCEICDPDWNPSGRTNPFWTLAQQELTQTNPE